MKNIIIIGKWMNAMSLKKETLKYLGYNGQILSDEQSREIDAAIEETLKVAQIRTVHRVFPIKRVDHKIHIDAKIDLNYPELLELLERSHTVLMIAATLGLAFDHRLRYYSKTDTAFMVIMDAAANALVELACDQLQADLPYEDYTFRFSPGYGQVPLSLQKDIIRLLDAQKRIGLTLTSTSMMVPQKSITGIVGVGDQSKKSSCDGCRLINDCEFRKRGTVCYKIH